MKVTNAYDEVFLCCAGKTLKSNTTRPEKL